MSNDSTLASIEIARPCTVGPPRLVAARVRRLVELGLRTGAEVTVLHRTAGGGRVVAVGDCRIALDRRTLEALPVGEPASS